MIPSKLLLSASALALALVAPPASAYLFGFSDAHADNALVLDGTPLPVVDSGWYSGAFHLPDNLNYLTALAGDVDADAYHNFFVFDISALAGPVGTAAFSLYAAGASEAASFSLYDYSGTLADLQEATGDLDATFGDLGSGQVYGVRDYAPVDSFQTHTIALTPAFLADLNAAIADGESHFVVGGAARNAAVPEPSALALAALGLVGLAALRRRQR